VPDLRDFYGTPVRLSPDPGTGMLNIDAGSEQLTLTRPQWALLVSYGDEAFGIFTEANDRV
jgi:hypothetical protein